VCGGPVQRTGQPLVNKYIDESFMFASQSLILLGKKGLNKEEILQRFIKYTFVHRVKSSSVSFVFMYSQM
jgi:hypothetical protein